MIPLRLLILPLLLSGCARLRDAETAAAAAIVIPDQACGMTLVMDLRRSPTERLRGGEAISACQLPTRAQIESACEAQDMTLASGVQPTNADPAQGHKIPDYSVENAHCIFGEDKSAAACSFDFAAGGSPVRQVTVPMTFRFLDLSDDMAHDYYWTLWEADKSCRPV